MIIFTNAELDELESFIGKIEQNPEEKKKVQSEHPGADFEKYALTLRKLETVHNEQTRSQSTRGGSYPQFYSLEHYAKVLGDTDDYSAIRQQIASARAWVKSFHDTKLSNLSLADLVEAAPVLLELFQQNYIIVPKNGVYRQTR